MTRLIPHIINANKLSSMICVSIDLYKLQCNISYFHFFFLFFVLQMEFSFCKTCFQVEQSEHTIELPSTKPTLLFIGLLEHAKSRIGRGPTKERSKISRKI